MEKLIKHFTKKQRTLLLIDSIGSFITASLLFVIMQKYSAYFGMPKTELTYLCIVAVCFCIYSACYFLFLKGSLIVFIRLIAFANLVYCVSIIGLLIKHASLLTIIGTAYFLIEIAIICTLSYVELNVATRNNKNRPFEN
ncbi:hypothetical protein [Pedobacter arcticus]|uniref:hypothetical protein n=1 Tax=Pedobacter arcticus TaxID=752140 RepID=UPI00035FFA52|nr:hypothetical protein [Pedobacter arcticus]